MQIVLFLLEKIIDGQVVSVYPEPMLEHAADAFIDQAALRGITYRKRELPITPISRCA